MANRFPLIVDSSGTAAIKELASGDNLDLTGNGIVGAGTVALTNLTVGGSQGTDGQVLTSTGSGIAWEDASGGSSTFGVSTMTGDGSDTTLTLSADPGSENNTQVYIDGVYQPKSSYSVSGTTLTFSTAPPNNTSVEAIVGASVAAGVPSDASVTSAKLSGALTTPSSLTLGGNLDVSGHDIVTVSNAAIELDPNGSGVVTFKGNSTRGAGQFKLNCENNSHGITIKGPPHSAAASYTLTLPNTDGNADQVLKTDGSGNLDWVDQSSGGGGGGGMWTQIATTTISSETFSVEFTNLGSYDEYELRFTGVGTGTAQGWQTLSVNFDYGSGYVSSGYRYKHFYHSSSQVSGSLDYQGNTNVSNLPITAYKFGYNSGTVRTPAFGLVGWTSAGAMFWAKGYSNRESNDYGLKYQQLIASHSSYETTAPTKIKLFIMASGSASTTAGEGMRSGKFTLYGRAAS